MRANALSSPPAVEKAGCLHVSRDKLVASFTIYGVGVFRINRPWVGRDKRFVRWRPFCCCADVLLFSAAVVVQAEAPPCESRSDTDNQAARTFASNPFCVCEGFGRRSIAFQLPSFCVT